MVVAKVYNQEGEVVGDEKLNPAIFGVEIKKGLVQQAVVTQQANARFPLAHTKDRSEVRGGGAKPWRQKGTGRARHGSIRSPIWKGGGVTFGPRTDRSFQKKINRKAKRKALFMVLSDKASHNKIAILNQLKLEEFKTKRLLEILKKLPVKDKKTMIILPGSDKKIIKSAANLSKVSTIRADNLNVVDLLKFDWLLILKNSLKKMEEVYLKS